jgi:heterotetrameric sarcosine oxidase gamma subunit
VPDLVTALRPSVPFAVDPVGDFATPGVLASHLDGIGIASVQIRCGAFSIFAERAYTRFGLRPSLEPRCVLVRDQMFVGVGPGSWFAIGSDDLPATLQAEFSDVASVADQSSGYVVLRLTGAKVRDALAKLIPIDLHPSAFQIYDAAATVAAHIGVMVWRCEDGPDGCAVFGLACFRSFSPNLVEFLKRCATTFGFALRSGSA